MTLNNAWPAFCFGNVAPDHQALCDVPREKTHFCPLPVPAGLDAGALMLTHYPNLRAKQGATDAQAAFIAGCLSHLRVDLIWFWEVLVHCLVEATVLGSSQDRLFLHNLTLIEIDRQFREQLPQRIDSVLRGAIPNNWLPFAADAQLVSWRDCLVE